MSPAAIRNMVISLVLVAEAEVDVDAEFFEMISQMNLITGETFSVSIKARCRLMEGRGPSKADGWQQKYFFVHVNPASVADPSAVFRTEWNPEPGSSFVSSDFSLFLLLGLLILRVVFFSDSWEMPVSSVVDERSLESNSWFWETFLGCSHRRACSSKYSSHHYW